MPPTLGVAVIVSVMVSPTYGLPSTGADGEGVVAGVSITIVPKVCPEVGCKVSVFVVEPVYGAVKVVNGSTGPTKGDVAGIRSKVDGTPPMLAVAVIVAVTKSPS